MKRLALPMLICLTGCVAVWGNTYHVDLDDGSNLVIRYDSVLIGVTEVDNRAEQLCEKYHRRAARTSLEDAAIVQGGSLMRASYACVPFEQAAPTSNEELLFWDSIKNSTNPDDFREYIRQFPNGLFVGLAKNRIENLPRH